MSDVTSPARPAVTVTGLTVQYPGVKALDAVDFSISPGEVRALMGRNGAGKSTLVKVLSGVETGYIGTVTVDGGPVAFRDPRDAMRSGIATVYQELAIIPSISIAENVTLGNWARKRGVQIDRREVNERARQALAQLGEEFDLNAPAGTLSIARQQLVEIAHALTHNPRVLILDEPTSSLPVTEVDRLLKLVRRLAATGVAVIFVSHRMDEISRVADSVTIVRDGQVIETLPIDQAPVERVAALMVGPDFQDAAKDTVPPPTADAPVALRVTELSDGRTINGVSLAVQAGEIVGIAGLLGSGRTELLRAVGGLSKITRGSIEVAENKIHKHTPGNLIKRGVTLVPEDRKAEGVVLGLSVQENLWMSSKWLVSRLGIISPDAVSTTAQRSKRDLDIKVHDTRALVGTLSGGNQQKVVLGRCLNAGAKVLLLDEPTRGVDVHAKAQIYDLIRSFAAQGGAVVMVSSEYEELLLLCHSIAIMSAGRVTDRFRNENVELTDLYTRVMRTDTHHAAAH
jgi:ABC-type sugar transport system ATPase subunit